MQNKLLQFIREQKLIAPGDRVICALSGGADSVAMLFALFLLREKLKIQLEAAHFNHHLRGEESQRDEAFARDFCARYDIPLHVGGGQVQPGKKGLEAAARDARYAFLQSLDGKIATAHTADDNAETVLLHLIRGTGLKGLGGIAPQRGALIRPMLSDLRESGAIEQDADIVMFLYRDDYYNEDSEKHNIAECIVAKNRHGETGKVELRWMPEYTQFATLDNRYDDEE